MRPADEIKKGLECCSNVNFVCNEECPYYKSLSEGEDCCLKKNADALALIQQKERENETLTDDLIAERQINKEQLERIQQLEAERAELLDLCEQFGQCVICEHTDKGTNESPCCDCWYCNGDATGSRWQWRGVMKEGET